MITPEIVTAVALWCGSQIRSDYITSCKHKFTQCINDKQADLEKEQRKIDRQDAVARKHIKKNGGVVTTDSDVSYIGSKILNRASDSFSECFKKIED